VSEEEILESLGLKHVARTSDGKIDHAKLSMKDRMAIVRGMRKRRKKGAFLIEQEGKKSKITIGSLDENESIQNELDDRGIVAEGQYNGFINASFEKFHANPPVYDGSDCNAVEKRKIETDLEKCSQPQFLANLDLFTGKEVDSVLKVVQTFSQEKIHYRNMTYIPEILDKKQRYYTYLAPDINSPPLLRTRQRRPVTSNTASRLTSRSNSLATTPERSVTRQLSSVSSSNDSNEGNTLANGKKDPAEKMALENEMADLKKRSQELQSILGANKRTISTRKERSRLSEVSDEASQLELRIMQIKKMLVKL